MAASSEVFRREVRPFSRRLARKTRMFLDFLASEAADGVFQPDRVAPH